VRLVVALAIAGCGQSAAQPDANPDDVDGDGVMNAADNCPMTVNRDQHDEDGDGVGDTCDNCPAVANRNQSDTGETQVALQLPDGVGDACDLRPSISGDRLAAFFTFADASRDDDWTAAGWVVANDTATADIVASWRSPKPQPFYGGIMAEARFASVQWQSPAAMLTVAVDGDAVQVGAGCALEADRSGGMNDQLHAWEVGGATMSTALGAPLDPTMKVEITAWRSIDPLHNTAKLTCIAKIGDVSKTLVLPTTDFDMTGDYTVAAADVHAVATSVIVYTSPGAPRK
jgi:hypothetical protein